MSHLSSKELEILKQDMVARLDVFHDYLPKISETVAVTGTVFEQVKEISDLSCNDKSLLKLFDEGIHKYLCERAWRSEETHQLLVSKKSIKGKVVAAAVSGHGDELECFNDHLHSDLPSFLWKACPAHSA